VPRAKLDELSGYRTTSQVSQLLDLSSYLIKARIDDGLLPPASRVSDAGVLLFDDDWVTRAREAIAQSEPRRRRRATSRSIASPAEWLGHELGEPGWLPEWGEVSGYFSMLAEASERVELETAGLSTQGNPYLVVRVSAEANLLPERQQRNREILARLWDGRDEPAPASMLDEGRSVGFILASQHSTEIGSLLMTMQLAWELAVATDEDSLQILEETITVLIPSHNPDGIQMIAEWYRQSLGEVWEGTWMPWLYHPFVGHDNNRDWFMQTQVETRMYVDLHNREHPQAVFDMHQMGRFGPRFMVPPFIDPLDPNQDPVVQQGFAALGTHIAQRMTAAGQAGVVTNAIFDNYSPSLAYGNYHGSVDLLSEAASVKLATPVTLKDSDLNADYGIDPRVRAWNQPLVWEAGEWSLKDIVAYDLVAARAFLEHLARNRRQWLTDYQALNARTSKRERKPYGFVIPPIGRDPQAVAELLDILQRGLVEIQRAVADVTVDGVTYPAGTWVISLDQPAGAFAKTLLEIQRYPELRAHPEGPLKPPYDISGHTLPIQMGVPCFQADSPLPDDGALEVVTDPIHFHGSVQDDEPDGTWWLFPATSNAIIGVLAALQSRGVPVFRAMGGGNVGQGDVLVRKADLDPDLLDEIVRRTGSLAQSRAEGSVTPRWRQAPVRIGLYQSWTSCIDEGWARWILEQYEVPYLTLRNADIRQGGLAERVDVLVLPEMTVEEYRDGLPEKNREGDPNPAAYRGGLGEIGVAALREFVRDGGTLIGCDGSAEYAIQALALPVENMLERVGTDEFSCPGSLLQVIVDPDDPLCFGLPRELAVLFLNSRVFRGTSTEATTVGRYPQTSPLLSGWISGDEKIHGGGALVDVRYGRGNVVLFGFRPWFRAQSRGTYRAFFNAVYRHGLSVVGELPQG
jgi:hypothetical protein